MDGDGASEVLLEGSGYNMGQLITAVDAVKLEANGTTRVAQSIPEVYADSCENPVGKKTGRRRPSACAAASSWRPSIPRSADSA